MPASVALPHIKSKMRSKPVLVGTVRHSRRAKTKHAKLGVVEPNATIRRILKLADDGRKRSTSMLPPLESEPSFNRAPRKGSVLHALCEESVEKRFKRISMELDRKIVSHLRRSLTKRLDKRYGPWENPSLGDQDDYSAFYKGRISRNETDPRKRLFASYNELGEKLNSDGEVNSTRTVTFSDSQSSGIENGLTPLPEIGTSAPKSKRVSLQEPTQNGLSRDGTYMTEFDPECNGETDERNAMISPVQTPVVYRPETRESDRISVEDRRTQMLQGFVHRLCPPDNKVVKMYLSSGFLDTQVERTVLMERVLPSLREFCLNQGHELQVYDLHWAMRDAVLDDHSMPELCKNIINQCHSNALGINFLLFLGEKYGPYLLPVEILADDFDKIAAVANADRDSQLLVLKSKIHDLENTRAERERARKNISLEVDNETSPNTLGVPRRDSIMVRTNDNDTSPNTLDVPRRDSIMVRNKDNEPTEPPDDYKFRRRGSVARKEGQSMKALKEEEEELPETSLLEQWYIRDDNCVPPVYRLQKISTIFKDINKVDRAKSSAARYSWEVISRKLIKIFQTFAPKLVEPQEAEKYFESLIEVELDNIVGDPDTTHTLCIKRTLSEVRHRLIDRKASEYVDVDEKHPDQLDLGMNRRMDHLRSDFLKHKLRDNHIHNFEVEWAEGGVVASGNREHFLYLERMCKAVHDSIQRQLEEEFEGDRIDRQRKLCEEVSQHVMACHSRAKQFHGRKDILQQIKTYIRSQSASPLVIYGKPGSGKSAILSKVAKDTHKWIKGEDVRVIVRSVGVTSASTNVRTLLLDICRQMCEIVGSNYNDVPTDYKGLVNNFAYRINQTSEHQPLVIIIDALDRITDDHDGRKVTWLPKELPKHVHLIVSTLPDEQYDCFQALQKTLEGMKECFVEVTDLPTGDAMAIVEHWLKTGDRELTHEQFDTLMDTFQKCPTPLFMKLAYKETLRWSSYMNKEQTKLADSVNKMAAVKFGKLERDHGESLVRRALGYITASRSGVTSNEMEDLLSLDDVVMDDITTLYAPPVRRLPSLLWIRLKDDLSDYLTEVLADNMKTIIWSHGQFKDAAEERYMNQRDKAPSYHKAMAEYFMSTWAETPKPYSGSEKGSLRLVMKQDLYSEPEESKHDGTDRIYNLRKINELPHHLLRSQQNDLLKSETLCNFEWVLSKLSGAGLRALLEEYHIVLLLEPGDVELKSISDTLHLSGNALYKDPRQLASQVIGRLNGIIARDVPKTAADPRIYPYIHSFVAQARASSLPSLVPSVECLTEPGGILFDLLSGHTDPITALTPTTDGLMAITTSLDNTMKLWDIRTGRVRKTIDGVGANVSFIRTAKNNTLAVTTERTTIRIWNIKLGSCVHVIDKYVDPATITVVSEGRLLVALFDGSNMFCSWELESFNQICEKEIPEGGIHKDNSLLVSDGSPGDQVLYAFRASNYAIVQNGKSGKVLHTLTCHDKSSSIVALGYARDYYILCCRQYYLSLHEIHQLELFDVKKGRYLRSVRGCVNDHITALYINLMGSHAIAICATEKANLSDIAIWNLETEDHKHLGRHSGVSTMGACIDFRFCLTAAKGDKTLRIWNLSNKINLPAPKLKKSLGIIEIMPMVSNPQYIVAKAINNGPISVWNIVKAKCLQSAVRIERGLTEFSDVLLMRNTRLVILTDRGFSTASEESKPVFQTILIYNLRTKRYEKKLTDCYIVPAPSHEYLVIDDDHLMGPSDNRTHFMVWSLITGHVVHRIRTNFKKLDRLKKTASVTEIPNVPRGTTANMTPWDRRAETKSARQRRHERELEQEQKRLEDIQKEKDNGIEQFIVSGDEKVIVASYYAHHMCVFSVPEHKHTQTLESTSSMMFLHASALTYDGSYLVHANYDEQSKISYVTLWDCSTGQIKKRLKNEADVCALGITDNAERVVIGKSPNQLHIWDPMKSSSFKKIKGYAGLEFGIKSKIFIGENGTQAVVFAGDISVWDLEKMTILAVFTPDTRIMCCHVALDGKLIAFGLYEKTDVICLKLMSNEQNMVCLDNLPDDLFDEKPDSSDDEEEGEGEETEDTKSSKSGKSS